MPPEINPGQTAKEKWELGFRLALREYRWNHWAPSPDELLKERIDLPILPGSDALATDKDGGRSYPANLFLELP